MKGTKTDNSDILLLEKGKRGVARMLFGRLGIVLLLLMFQVMLLFGLFRYLDQFIPFAFGGFVTLTVIMVLHIINTSYEPTIKMSWIILVTILPAFGALLYLFIDLDIGHRAVKERLRRVVMESSDVLLAQEPFMERLRSEDEKELYRLGSYTWACGSFPVYENSDVRYFPLGEEMFQEMLIQLEKAKSFIFMEYFIVDEGYMWGRILKLLSEKARQGVEIRFMYDGTCEFALLPHNYPKKLHHLGIQCKIFSPVTPFLSTHYNYRDHRKILVIDGLTAFTGGVNLADEYINQKELYGHWKDTGVMVKGEAVNSFTYMFLQMWSIDRHEIDYKTFILPKERFSFRGNGYVIPFGDSPLDRDRVGEMVYMHILNRAVDYVHIMTPYLILDGEMTLALQYAARRGVDVKLILPHIPDKMFAFALAKTHYRELMADGVEIYEYTPGFVHAKVFVSDHARAVVGTINLDYRSLYHHFECALYMDRVPAVADIERDFQSTLGKSQRITTEDVRHEKLSVKLTGKLLKPFAPLM